MEIPKTISLYCSHCRKHAEFKLREFKPAKARSLSWGTRQNVRKHKKGYGGKAEFVKKQKKQTKKPTYLAECTVCKKKTYHTIPKRMKKSELKS